MLRVKEFANPQLLEDYLNGTIVSVKSIGHMPGVDLRGKTLIFTTPALTVTFPNTEVYASANAAVIIGYINTQAGTKIAEIRNYGFDVGKSNIALVRANDVLTGGTAASILGLVAGTVGSSAVPLAKIAQVVLTPANRYLLVHEV